jgi:hypothetical protein
MKMTEDVFKQYLSNPLGMDTIVRNTFKIPDNKYYSVSVWPPERQGYVWITKNLSRKVETVKISKSDQKTDKA